MILSKEIKRKRKAKSEAKKKQRDKKIKGKERKEHFLQKQIRVKPKSVFAETFLINK